MSIFDEGSEISFYGGVSDEIRVKHEAWDRLMTGLKQKLLAKGLPAQAVFEITPLCNLSCKMCFVRLDKEKMDSMGKLMTAAQWLKITEETENLGVCSILITGGEPFTHPDFIEIYTNIMKMGFRVILFTNAVMLTDKILETLKKYPPHYLYITIYGSSENTYEKVCGNGKAYNSVVKNIKILRDALNFIPVNLRTTIVRDNVNDLVELKDFAEQMNMKFSFGFGTFKPVRGAKHRDFDKTRLSAEEIIDARKSFLAAIKDERSYKIYERAVSLAEEELLRYDGSKINITKQMKKVNCAAAGVLYAITWDGKMLPCQNFSKPYALPMEIGIKAAWEELQKIKDGIQIPDRCIRCKHRYYCGTCHAAIQAESGTYIDGEPYNCMCPG